MALTKIPGELFSVGDLDISDVGIISLDAIQGDADSNTSITFSGSDVITIATGGSGRLTIGDGALSPVTDNQIDLGTSSLEFKNAYFDGVVTSDSFVGPLTGNADTATVATTVTITDNENTNETNAIIFTAGGDVDGGNIGLESDGDLTYNPSSGTLTATTFVGALTGNVTGNASGTAATVTGGTQASITTLANATTVGALDAGSITSGFGTIDTGSSAITTTGLITGGSLDIDNVLINGTTIGHTDDTDLITLADGVVTVAGEISVTTLDIGGTNVASTAAELNIMDGDTSASSTTLADADRVVVNDNGTMKQVALTDFETYFESAIDTIANLEVSTELQTPLIAYTDGDDAITIADGGKVTFSAAAVGKQHEPAAGSSLTPDFNTYQHFLLDANANFTLSNPTTENVGQSGVFVFSHNGGARTLSIGTQYMVPAGGTAITLSTGGAGVVDIIPYYVYATDKVILGKPQLDVKD